MSWRDRFAARGSALCVGLDPVPERIPQGLSVAEFCCDVIDASAEYAACFKPNIAFFERCGEVERDGLPKVLAAARERRVPVILDAKRGDVPSTSRAYAETYFGGRLDVDALTVSPFCGLDGVAPFAQRARELDRGVFLLLRTSNPGAEALQAPVEKVLVEAIRSDAVFGAVVGATDPETGARLRAALPDTLFLVPGFGAQGGDDLKPFFREGAGAVVNSSRGILYAGEGRRRSEWKDAVREAARVAHETIERARKG